MILSVIGARPQFIKAAAVSRAFAKEGVEEAIIHTGQHYDDAMSGRFLRELGIEHVIANLGCGSGSHAVQTSQMMIGLERQMLAKSDEIDAVLVYGDTNSSLAAALVTAKISIPIIHVEAGLRSFNRSMPEEINRVVIDHLSSLLFCSSETGVEQLKREGINAPAYEVGDVMLDAFHMFKPKAPRQQLLPFSDAEPFTLATIHRPSNTDAPEQLKIIVDALSESNRRIVWPVHPRLGDTLAGLSLPKRIELVAPLSYFEMLAALEACQRVVTDSGGLQKEAHWAKRPCVTVRSETEWVETLRGGWNQLWGPQDPVSLADKLASEPSENWSLLYGTGTAASDIARRVSEEFTKI